jgi:putative solute:sodium symporter small subunit
MAGGMLFPDMSGKEKRRKIMSSNAASEYWKANLRLVIICLVIWFVVSYGFGILLVEPLNAIKLGGYKLGFWFAQQGSIYTFVALIFFYAARMNALDRKFNVHED